ncbi:MAG: diguanylate cyclase, partial [Frankiaceae bacterium]|nr:diguanylate cyclase [Frankiaceae bacterium]
MASYYVIPVKPIQEVFYDVIGVVCLAAIGVGIRRHRPTPSSSWWLITAGIGCFVVGDLIWSYFTVVRHVEKPFPSIADAFYLTGYPVLALALWKAGRAHRDSLISHLDAA